jgi:hypothetical protein
MAPVLLDGERFRWKFRIELRLAHHTLLLLWNTTILRRESRSPESMSTRSLTLTMSLQVHSLVTAHRWVVCARANYVFVIGVRMVVLVEFRAPQAVVGQNRQAGAYKR